MTEVQSPHPGQGVGTRFWLMSARLQWCVLTGASGAAGAFQSGQAGLDRDQFDRFASAVDSAAILDPTLRYSEGSRHA
jgi:hypothetical protein